MPKTCAVIPAFNEAKSIQNVTSRTKKFVDMVLVVDDGSTDGTAKLAANAGAKVLQNQFDRAAHLATLCGIKSAKCDITGNGIAVLLNYFSQGGLQDLTLPLR